MRCFFVHYYAGFYSEKKNKWMMSKRGKMQALQANVIEKTISLVIVPGIEKKLFLRKVQAKIVEFANILLTYKQKTQTYNLFHHLVYNKHKYLGIHSQLQEAVQRKVFAARKA